MRAQWLDRAALLLFAILSVEYFWRAIALAAHAPLWMDEVLAVWTARQPDVPSVWAALLHGSEFTPPLYDTMLHGLVGLGASSPLVFRLPSILAVYLAALAMGAMVRRHGGWTLAALAAGMLLCSGIFGYAVQARPYACLMAVFAWTIVLWDSQPTREASRGRAILMCALMTVMVALHFYAILLVGTIVVAELLLAAIEGRMPRASVLLAASVAGGSLLLWRPILDAAAAYSHADADAPLYYAKPTLERLVDTYRDLFGWLAAPIAAALLWVLVRRTRSAAAPRIGVTALILCAVPLGVFAFALLISKSYSTRYALALTLGVSLLTPWLFLQLGKARKLATLTVLAILVVIGPGRNGGEIARKDRLDLLALVRTAPGDSPIVTGSGLRFLELVENTPPDMARRIVYLDLSAMPSPDPTNQHQVERWKAIRPLLRVVEAQKFLCATPVFLLVMDPSGGTDGAPEWLKRHARFAGPRGDVPSLTLVRTKPCVVAKQRY